MSRWSLRGVIASAGFASGDLIVVGKWDDSPIGAFTDVMWADPAGRRTLLAPDAAAAELVGALYEFEDVRVVDVVATGDDRWLAVEAGPLEVQLKAGGGWRIPFPRPPWFTRLVEGPVARVAMGVRVYGTTYSGVRQWYRTDTYRAVQSGWATIDGRDLGALHRVRPPNRFGFTDLPPRPSMVAVRPLLDDPAGQLDEVVLAAARRRVVLAPPVPDAVP